MDADDLVRFDRRQRAAKRATEREMTEEQAFDELAALAWWSENDHLSYEELERRLTRVLGIVREQIARRRR